jgi:hypothetical protein
MLKKHFFYLSLSNTIKKSYFQTFFKKYCKSDSGLAYGLAFGIPFGCACLCGLCIFCFFMFGKNQHHRQTPREIQSKPIKTIHNNKNKNFPSIAKLEQQ